MTPAGEHLAEVQAARSRDAFERAVRGIRSLEKSGRPVSFSAVAKEAGVGRAFLYNSVELRQEIEKLRTATGTTGSGVPAAERASNESLKTRLRASQEENQRLRAEVAELKEELALAHGEVRQLKSKRAPRPVIQVGSD